MSRKVKVGITRDFQDKDGKWIMPGPGLKILDAMPNVEYEVFRQLLPVISPDQIKGCDMVISLTPKWTQETIADNKQVLAVMRRGVGYDNVDVPAVTKEGILLTITPNAIRRPIATAIVTFMLALSTNLMAKDKLIRENRWADRPGTLGYGLRGRTLGSIGVGNIGHEVFRLAQPFEMKHIAYDPYVKQEQLNDVNVKLVSLEEILAESDWLNLSCMLNGKTYHIIGEKELQKMKRTAFLINAGRGALVDEAALVKALQQGWIRGAALDVFEKEPTSPDNPLLIMPNVILTPHNIGWTDLTMIDLWDELMQQVSQIISGNIPDGLVNREVLDNPVFQNKFIGFLCDIKA